MLSPVIAFKFKYVFPSIIVPSHGIFSNGYTIKISPGLSFVAVISFSVPFENKCAVSGKIFEIVFMSSLDLLFAIFSKLSPILKNTKISKASKDSLIITEPTEAIVINVFSENLNFVAERNPETKTLKPHTRTDNTKKT